MSHPPAKWKVAYEAWAATLDNGALLNEAIFLTGLTLRESRDNVRESIVHTELTRRLTAIGFLPPAPANDTEGWIGVIQQKRPLPPVPGKPPRLPHETDMEYWSRTTPRSQGGDGV